MSHIAKFCPLLLLLICGAQADTAVPRFERDGTFPLELTRDEKIDTGFLVVREDRSKRESRLIRLPVAILRSSSSQPAPDPVLYLPGGPGGSALNTARYGFAYPFLKHRDFVIFEPRGARFSEPSLACPDVAAARVQDAIRQGREFKPDAEVVAARRCREQARAAGVDPSAYTTAAIAADLDDLRRALGYEQWNLYAVSYGTRVALTILRQYPGTVRSAVLDSVLPPNVRYDEQIGDNQARSFELLFRDCEADPACSQAFPDLRRRWQALVRAAAQKPLEVSVSADKDAPVRTVVFRGESLASIVPLSSSGSLPELPRLLQGIAENDAAELARIGRWAQRPSEYAWGLRYSVWCTEETPFVKPAVARKARLVVSPQVCDAWKVRPVSRAVHEPVVSDVPVLLLSGEYDAETPPTWAAEAERTLSKGQTITFRGMGHVPSQEWSTPCAMSVADAFLREPAAPLDPACVKVLKAPAFKTGVRTEQ